MSKESYSTTTYSIEYQSESQALGSITKLPDGNSGGTTGRRSLP